ncbi:MAG: GDP-mannose 4,6-dehydratase, partial [Muribaculaceae bacterium]|nr:GDP-mannose 4,6-dehydratase [Muribaculaceae bacterium]
MTTTHKSIMITGGAGFIGSHLVRLMVNRYPACRIVNVDALTYAGNPDNLTDVASAPNYRFELADITDTPAIEAIMRRHAVDGIIHLAAESHVDRSIADPLAFVRTNVEGTMSLLIAARSVWDGDFAGKRFHHVSTDEVFGALPADRPDL